MTLIETDSTDSIASQLVRFLFGSALAILGFRNFTHLEGRVAYAESKDVPNPDTLVPLGSGLLLGGGLGIGLWKLPRLSAASLAAFFVGITPLMHDFWAVGPDQRDEELTAFLQNVALFGAALAFFVRANED